MKKKKGLLFALITIILTGFILFIAIMQNNFNSGPEVTQINHKEIHSKKEKETILKSAVEEPNKTKKEIEERNEKNTSEKINDKPVDSKKAETNENKKSNTIANKTTPETTTKYVTVSSLNVRSGPGTQHQVIGAVTMNQELNVESGQALDGWVKIVTKDISGYVNQTYLSNNKVIEQAAKKNEKATAQANKGSASTKNSASKKAPKKEQSTSVESKEEKNKQVKNDADKLQSVSANNQLILVTSKGYGTSKARVQTFERNASGTWDRVMDVPGYIGKNGFAASKVEGDGKSPTGKYSIGTAFGRSGNPGTKLPFRGITADDVWVDDSNSSYYNSWQSKKATSGEWSSAENMDIALYTYGFVINYNTARTPGKGSAIFFHIANGHTLGCTGVSQANMVSILKWIDPAKNPIIIQTPVSELSKY